MDHVEELAISLPSITTVDLRYGQDASALEKALALLLYLDKHPDELGDLDQSPYSRRS